MVKVMAESLSVAAGAAGGASRSIQEAFQQRIAQQSASGDQAPVQAAEQSVTARAIEANGQTPRVDASQQATDTSRVSVSQEAIARLASERASGVADTTAAPTAQDDAAPPGVVPSQSLRGQIDELLGDRAPGSSVASVAREQSPESQPVGQSVARVATESSGLSAVARRQAEDVRAENQSNPSSVGGGVEVSGRNRITPQQ